MSARFKIRRHPTPTPTPTDHLWRWILKDRQRPAFIGQYLSHDRALAAMDNAVRAERGMPSRLSITRREIREAMTS